MINTFVQYCLSKANVVYIVAALVAVTEALDLELAVAALVAVIEAIVFASLMTLHVLCTHFTKV